MKKFALLLVTLMMTTGCAGVINDWFGFGDDSGKSGDKARQQLSDARASFDQKIKAAPGKSMSQLQKEWGKLEQGVSRDGLTVYRWRQTAKVTPPAGETVMPASNSSGQETFSCLAMFIVSYEGVVVDATSEGQCVDYQLMPAWRPNVTQSTDGNTGSI